MTSYRKSKSTTGFLSSLKEIVVLLLIVFVIRTYVFGLYQVPTGSMETTMLVGERFFANKFTYLFSKPQRGDIIAFNDPLFEYSNNKLKCLFQDYVWGPSNWTKRVIGLPGQTVQGKIEEGRPVIYVNGTKLDEPYINSFPLIGLWRVDKADLDSVEQEAVALLMQKRLDPSLVSRFMEHRVGMDWRSYDPAYSYQDQPFYRINAAKVALDASGLPQLKEPGTPLTDHRIKGGGSGENHWNGTDEFFIKLDENQYWVMGDNRLGSNDSRFFGPLDGRLIHGKIVFRIWSLDSSENWWILDLLAHPIDFWSRIRWSRFFQVMH